MKKPLFKYVIATIIAIIIFGIAFYNHNSKSHYSAAKIDIDLAQSTANETGASPTYGFTTIKHSSDDTNSNPVEPIKNKYKPTNNNQFLFNIEVSLPTGLTLESVESLFLNGQEVNLSTTKVSLDHYGENGQYPKGTLSLTGRLEVRVSVNFIKDEARGDYYLLTPNPPIQFQKSSLINEYFHGFYISPELAMTIRKKGNRIVIKKIGITIWDNDENGSYINDEDVFFPTNAK